MTADIFNRQLVEAVKADGKVFISSTLIDGKFFLRLAVLHFRTHLPQVDYLLGLLKKLTLNILIGAKDPLARLDTDFRDFSGVTVINAISAPAELCSLFEFGHVSAYFCYIYHDDKKKLLNYESP